MRNKQGQRKERRKTNKRDTVSVEEEEEEDVRGMLRVHRAARIALSERGTGATSPAARRANVGEPKITNSGQEEEERTRRTTKREADDEEEAEDEAKDGRGRG